MKKNRLVISFLTALSLLLLAGTLAPQKAMAALSGNWVNIATLEVDGKRYQEDKIDNNWHFYLVGDDDGCPDEIDDLNYNPDNQRGNYALPSDNEVKLQKRKKSPSGCTNDGGKETVNLGNKDGARYSFNWIDSGSIEIPGQGTRYRKDDNLGGAYVKTDDNQCKDTLVPSADKSSLTLIIRVTAKRLDTSDVEYRTDLRKPYQGHSWVNQIDYNTKEGDGCIISDTITGLPVGLVSENAVKAAGTGVGSTKTSGAGNGSNSCESKDTMGWILCPVIKILDGIFNWLDSQIQALLEVNEDAYTDPDLYEAWSNIRNIAFIVLIPIMMVMVIGTALGSEMFSAYTVKKAIPRMVAAILFITLSWYICGFFIAFFNVMGAGVMGLITSPFGLGADATLSNLFDQGTGGTLVQGGSVILGAFALVTVEGLLGIVASYLLVAALVLFIAFIILTIRQLIILGLILAAPLAILAWIFPGNDKPWKFWWGTFSKLLMMYPLITGLIALGRVFAHIVGTTPAGGAQGGLLNPLLKITAYIVPYALIPLTFKFAGGAFATLTGMVNDRSRGLFDRMKKGRQKQFEHIGDNAKSGKFLRVRGGEHSLTNRFNEGVQSATLQGAGGFAVGAQRKARIAAARSRHEMDEAKEMIEKDGIMRPIVKDDDKLWAVMHGTNEAEMRQILIDRAPGRFNEYDKKRDLDQAVEEAMAFRKHAGHNGSRIAATMANAATGTGYNYRQNADGSFTGDDDMMTAILDASNGDASMAGRMLAEMRPMATQSGRQDIAGGGYAHSMKVMSDLRRAQAARGGVITREMIDPTTGETLRDAAGNARTITGTYGVEEARMDIMQDVLRSNAGAAVAGKVKGVKQLAPILKKNAEAALQANGPNATRNAARELATLAGKHDAAAQIAPQNARVLADEVLGATIDIQTMTPEMRAMLAPALVQVAPDGTQSSKLTGTITYQAAIEAMRGNADFQTMRREYQSSSIAAAQQANAAQLAAQQGVTPPAAGTGGYTGAGFGGI